MEQVGRAIIAAMIRGLSVPRDSDGKPIGLPAFVVEGPAARLNSPGLLSLPGLDFPGFPELAMSALKDWRVERCLSGCVLPGVVMATIDGEESFFYLGADPDSALARRAGGIAEIWEAKAYPDPPKGSANGRERVVSGRIALVTGGAQGFGEEIVRGLVSSGAFVWIADLNEEGSSLLADGLNAEYGKRVAFPLALDVSDEASCASAFSRISAQGGGLDLCVSNAGVLKAGSLLEQSPQDFRFVTDVNYFGFFLVARRAAEIMKAQNLGCPAWRTDIIQINSKSGLEGSNRNAAYSGSKFGGIGLVQSFALELVEFGIKVNAICPGNFFDGPLWSDPEKGLFAQYLRTGKVLGAKTVADVRSSYEAKVPMGRGCSGADVMRAIYAAVEQEYETGQAIPVTGGQVMLN